MSIARIRDDVLPLSSPAEGWMSLFSTRLLHILFFFRLLTQLFRISGKTFFVFTSNQTKT